MARTKGAFQKKPRPNDIRAKAWQAMRIMRRFTSPQIQTTSGISESNANHYLRALQRAGFIRVITQNESGKPGSFTLYQIARNSGPLHPIVWGNGQMYDCNTGIVYGEAKDKTPQPERLPQPHFKHRNLTAGASHD